MRIILPTFAEPPDTVLQGACIGDSALGTPFEPWQNRGVNWQGEMLLQGEMPVSAMTGDTVPRAMIGWNPYFGQASSIGPMATQGGAVGMVPIGPAKPVNPIIDPIQKFLTSGLPLDSTGAWFPQDEVIGYGEPAMSRVLSEDGPFEYPTWEPIPNAEIVMSGLLKTVTVANMSPDFGLKVYPSPVSYRVFALSGTTTDRTGAPLANCRVIAQQTGWEAVNGVPSFIRDTVSDGSGAFSIPSRNIDYQLEAYKVGSPDLAGITRNDVTPIAPVTIYLRNPTLPDGPYPLVGDVDLGVVYGPTSNLTGTLLQPGVADVKLGVQYGADGTEFTGTLAGGGGGGTVWLRAR